MEDGFEVVAAPDPVQDRGDRPPRVPLKAIENINLEAKIPLFYKVSRDSPTIPLVDKYSREALIVFSDRAKRDLSGGAKMFVFHSGDQQAIKDVLEWIMLCVAAGKAEKFQDVSLSFI
ncbi:MAG: hypothetical protein M1823_008338 [Watsoniomyces obsoletus]|nr:MAG: hypothetical protein M1823_008338 [Watsoniomyces obsoletus]